MCIFLIGYFFPPPLHLVSSTFGRHVASLSYSQCYFRDVGQAMSGLILLMSSFKPSPASCFHVFAKPESGFNPNNGADKSPSKNP